MPTTFDITLEKISTNYANGDRVEVYANVKNITDSEQSDVLTLEVDGVERFSRDITLDVGVSETFKLAFTANVKADTTRTLVVTTSDDSSEPDDVTLYLNSNVVRVRFENGLKQDYVDDASQIGPNT